MSSSSQGSHYDHVIIGAGIQGLAAGQTFLRLSQDLGLPTVKEDHLLLLDTNSTIGGVWCKANLYPTLRSNNLAAGLSFPSFPISSAGLEHAGVSAYAHIPGAALQQYLERYAEWAELIPYIRLQTQCLAAEEIELDPSLGPKLRQRRDTPFRTHRSHKGWRLTIHDLSNNGESHLTCSTLTVCTGSTSSPRPLPLPLSDPTFQSRFSHPIITFRDFTKTSTALINDPNISHVTVFGGSKAAYDSVYALGLAHKKVTWVIRKSGPGAMCMAPIWLDLGPTKAWLEGLVHMRPLTWFSPCLWGAEDGFGAIRNWLHGTKIGRWLVTAYWAHMTSDSLYQSGYTDAKRGNGVKGKEKLIPRQTLFWYATQNGIMNYERDFWTVCEWAGVEVIEEDLVLNQAALVSNHKDTSKTDEDQAGLLHFKSGRTLRTAAIVAVTGWESKPSITFSPTEKLSGMGIPSPSYASSEQRSWSLHSTRADAEILSHFPVLANGPPVPIGHPAPAPSQSTPASSLPPWRLWRYIAPPSQVVPSAEQSRNLVFLGHPLLFNATSRAEVSALWAWAYFHHLIPEHRLPGSEEEAKYEAALSTRYAGWRVPGSAAAASRSAMGSGGEGGGGGVPDMMMEGLPYIDWLMGDLGLGGWRKGKAMAMEKKGWIRGWIGWGWRAAKEIFGGGYGPEDYNGVLAEWVEMQKKAME